MSGIIKAQEILQRKDETHTAPKEPYHSQVYIFSLANNQLGGETSKV